MIGFFASSATTEDSTVVQPNSQFANTLILQVEEAVATWSGTIKVMTRVLGSSGGWHPRALVAEVDNSEIDGATGASVVGIYRCSVEGREVYIEHTRVTGAVRVSGSFVTA